MRILLATPLLILLAGCSGNPPPAPEGLRRPAAWVMKNCDPLPPIPVNDGDPIVRRKYHQVERPMYVECAAKVEELIKYVEAVAPQK